MTQQVVSGDARGDAGDDRLRVKQAAAFTKTNAGLSDAYDDSEGYYNFRVGEVMAGRCAHILLISVFCSVLVS